MTDHLYPPGIVDEILDELELTEVAFARAKEFGGVIGLTRVHETQMQRLTLPPRKAMAKVFGAAFFASLTQEEGTFCRVSVVCVIGGSSTLRERPEQWEVVPLEARPLSPETLAKLAPLSGVQESHLVLSCSGTEDVSVDGLAFPVGSSWFRSNDHYLRISTPQPGTLIISSGNTRLFRYSAGKVAKDAPPIGVGTREVPALATISRSVYGRDDRTFYIAELFERIVQKMRRMGHGGIIAVLEGDEIPPLLANEVRHTLPEPIRLGPALSRLEADEAMAETLTRFRVSLVEDDAPEWNAVRSDDLRVEARHQMLAAQIDRWIALLCRLACVDGAVLLSNSLSVLGFGLKIPASESPVVHEVVGYKHEEWPIFDLASRGTRHRAAASFVEGSRSRLALIISQDRKAAVFAESESKIVYWPIPGA